MRLLLATIGSAALLAATASASAQDRRVPAASTTIASVHGQSDVRAYRDVQVWTEYSAADRRRHVVVRRGGVISVPAAIPAGDERLEVDVGPGRDGAPVLAYVDCGRSCRVVVSGVDGRNPATVRGSANASSPTIWRDRVAWVRAGSRVLTRRLGGRPLTLPGAPRRKCYEFEIGRRKCERPARPRVEQLELRGSQLALVVRYQLSYGYEGGTSEVRLETIAGPRPRAVAAMNIGEGGQRWAGPAWANGDLFFYMSCPFSCGNSEGPYRFDPVSGRYAHAPLRGSAAGFAMDDDGRRAYRTYGCACDPADILDIESPIELTAPLTFRPWRAPGRGLLP